MSIRPPKALAPRNDLPKDPLSASLEHEVLAEKAATYGRLVAKLEKALEALREFEENAGAKNPECPLEGREARPNGRRQVRARPRRPVSETSGSAVSEREALLNAAGRALWYVMVQRDLCGFRRHDLFYKELKVPSSVRLRMGVARSC